MEMTLRASLGHLELRRMELDRARAEFEAASDLAHTFGTTGLQALIFNNLGIVYNQKNELGKARSCFQRAERLLVKSGEHRGIIVIACNLASIAAKTGDDAEASERLDHAAKLLRHYPGIRLEFQVGLTRGLVAYMQGDASAAIAAFERMIPLGRKLGDEQFVTYAEIYLAESELACGHYREALRRLLFWSKQDHEPHLGVFRRMTLSRLWPLEKLLGRTRNAGVSRKALEAIPRTEISLLEAWNDLFIAFGLSLGGEEAKTVLEGALSVFDRLKIPAGSRLAMVGLLYDAMRRGNTSRVRAALKAVESMGSSSNKVLSVLEPLSIADASLQLGEMERAEEALRRAGSAIVGLPFLELDWRMEFLRARIAEGHGDREGARNYLHRSLYTRNLLARALPARLRKGFLAQPRFKTLADLAARLERPAPAPLKAGSGQETDGFEGMIGHSRPIQQIFQTIQRLRDQDVPVLITGETGTGKELAAKAIHATSPRSTGPFYALHCASLPAELFESELFGYEAGAFTGATESRSGLLEHLAGGTLLFDEVSGLSVNTQMKVLRVLDSRVVRPLGSLNTRTIDVRFLASTSEPLEALVAEGRFRADLYYRLRGVEIHLPPLRARKDDLPFLVQHFLRRHARRLERTPPLVTTPAICFLKEHDWPGNVRELETVILRALITYSPGASLGIDSLRRLLPRPVGQALFPKDLVKGRNLETLKAELERVYLTQLFEEAGGDLGKMMKVLGVKRSSLYRWFSRVGIDPKELRESLA